MRIFRSISAVPASLRGVAVTIGNFDGVHRGHQLVMQQMVGLARERGITPMVMLFEPQPREFFTPGKAPSRLTTLREKVEALRPLGVEHLLCLRFNRELTEMEPEDFVQKYLVQGLDARVVIVGDDFRFGHRRRGDFALLRDMGQKRGFDLMAMHSFMVRERRVSSSWIRELLQSGAVEAANELLGRPYSITGRVIHGRQMGRVLGFPTANIDVQERSPPVLGVFAVQVEGLCDRPVNGVASLGTQPVFSGKRLVLETYLFDWTEEIYGRRIGVQFRHFLRPVRNFESVAALCEQMARDTTQAREYLATI